MGVDGQIVLHKVAAKFLTGSKLNTVLAHCGNAVACIQKQCILSVNQHSACSCAFTVYNHRNAAHFSLRIGNIVGQPDQITAQIRLPCTAVYA